MRLPVNGEVKKGDKTIQLKEGEKVTTVGEFIDNTGKKIANAWEATKEGVSDAADKVNKSGKDAINAFADGDEQRMILMGLKRFT